MLDFIAAWFGLYASEETEGQGLVEYALILAFVAIFVIVALIFFGNRLTAIYSRLANSIPTS